MSRVKSKDQLRIIGFKKHHLIPAAKEVLDFLSSISNVSAETENKCCQLKTLPSTCSESILSTEEDYESEESLCVIDFEEIDRVSNGYFDLMLQ